MNLDRVLQPHVCCLGNPVTGNPTQFIMSHAAKMCGIDWQFFTSHVEVQQFEVAFRGIQALGLRGAAILDPFQTVAIGMLDTVTASGIALNRVNVARSDGNSWIGDNTLGAAISNCIAASLAGLETDSPTRTALLCSSSLARTIRMADSKWNAKHPILFCPPESERMVAPELSLAEAASTESAEPGVATAASPNGTASVAVPSQELKPFEISEESMDTLLKTTEPIGFMMMAGDTSTWTLRQLQAIPFAERAGFLLLDAMTTRQHQQFEDFAKEKKLRLIEPVEWMAHQAVADFQFWTGVEPSVDAMREALEEYLQW